MSKNFTFNYSEAFSRNIGWITEAEQQTLRNKRIAIAGMGGVGGSHLLTLTRLGVGNFNIADFDKFELANFNRQMGATVSHIDQEKARSTCYGATGHTLSSRGTSCRSSKIIPRGRSQHPRYPHANRPSKTAAMDPRTI